MLTLEGSGFSDGNFTPPSKLVFEGPNGAITLPTTVCDSGTDSGKLCETDPDCANPGKCTKSLASLCDVNGQSLGVCAQLTVPIPRSSIVTGTAVITVLNPFLPANPQPAPLASNPVLFPMSTTEASVRFGNASVRESVCDNDPSSACMTDADCVSPGHCIDNGPQGLTAGDFNGDGVADLAVVNGTSSSISILLGVGDGRFTAASGSPMVLGNSLQPVAVASGDFNNDGVQDLAVVNENENTVSILTGNGDGTFGIGGTRFGTAGLSPVAVAVVDLDGDGNLDLAVINQSSSKGSPCNNSNGTNPQGSVALLAGDGMSGFSQLQSSATSFYTGTGGLRTTNPICIGGTPSSIAVGDLDGDGIPDIAVTRGDPGDATCNPGVGSVSLVLNLTNFLAPGPLVPAPTSFCAGRNPKSVAIGDFNGDHKADLAIADFSQDAVAILLGTGDTTSFPTKLFPTAPTAPLSFASGSSGPLGVLVGDFDSDQSADLAVLHPGAVTILRGDNQGNFSTDGGSVVSGTLVGLAAADLNGDGRLDLAASNNTSNAVSLMLQNPPLTFSPDHVNFGDVPENNTSGPQTITIINDSAAAVLLAAGSMTIEGRNGASFALLTADTNPCTLPQTLASGGGQCNIAVTFEPRTVGTQAAAVQVVTPTGISQSVLLSGNGLAPVLTSNPLTVAFGNTLIGTVNPTPVSVTISDIGTVAAMISGVSITGPNAVDFVLNDACTGSSLAAGSGTCIVGVTFAPAPPPPSGPGLRTGDITVSYKLGGVNGTFTIAIGLAGSATAPLVSLSVPSTTFPSQQVGTTSLPANVSLSNLGSWPLTIAALNGITIGGLNAADFAIQGSDCPLAPNSLDVNARCTTTIVFTPLAMNPPIGPRSGILTITDNNDAVNNSTQTVSLSGIATAPEASLSTSTLAFGGVPIGTTSAPLSFLLLNSGTAPLAIRTLNGIAISGANASDFSESDSCPRYPAALAPNANCSITVNLTPSAALPRNATLTITDNHLNSPTNLTLTQTVALGGAGTDFSMSILPASATVSPGKFATYNVTITPIDGFVGPLTLSCSVSPPTAKVTCTAPTSVVLNGTTMITSITAKNASKGTYTLTYAGTFTATPPALGTLTHSTTAKLIVK
jgi:hypothetical protein